MSAQERSFEANPNAKKGKRKARYCDLEGIDNVDCDYDLHGASTVSDQIVIPASSQHLDLVNKALCRKHYNKYIVNAKKKKTKLTNFCSHPKHEIYLAIPRKTEENKFAKTPERLTRFFSLPKEAIMCRHCLYRTDIDPEYINLPDYPPAIPKEKKNIRQFHGRSYVLRGDVIYSETQFQELESAYHEVCAELDEAKLGD